MKDMKTKDVALHGILLVLALILSYLETLLPLSFAIPGIKLGLPNIAVLFVLYRLGSKSAWTVSLLRVGKRVWMVEWFMYCIDLHLKYRRKRSACRSGSVHGRRGTAHRPFPTDILS